MSDRKPTGRPNTEQESRESRLATSGMRYKGKEFLAAFKNGKRLEENIKSLMYMSEEQISELPWKLRVDSKLTNFFTTSRDIGNTDIEKLYTYLSDGSVTLDGNSYSPNEMFKNFGFNNDNANKLFVQLNRLGITKNQWFDRVLPGLLSFIMVDIFGPQSESRSEEEQLAQVHIYCNIFKGGTTIEYSYAFILIIVEAIKRYFEENIQKTHSDSKEDES